MKTISIGSIREFKNDSINRRFKAKKIDDTHWIEINSQYGNTEDGKYLITLFQESFTPSHYKSIDENGVIDVYLTAVKMVDRREYGV